MRNQQYPFGSLDNQGAILAQVTKGECSYYKVRRGFIVNKINLYYKQASSLNRHELNFEAI